SKVYIANGDSNNVSVIDTATNTVIATIPVGGDAFGVAVTPDSSKVYIGNLIGNVSVIAMATNTVIATIPIRNPVGMAVTPDGSRLYVATGAGGGGSVSVIATATDTVTDTIPEIIGFGVADGIHCSCGRVRTA